VTGYEVDEQVPIPSRGKDLSLDQHAQTDFGAHLVYCPVVLHG